jgi:predicted lipoprotein
MKRTMVVSILAVCLSFAAGAAFADKVHDWHDLDAVHGHVVEAIHEMERARAANHYDMAGHGAKAEDHLRAAERELSQAIEASKMAH